MESGNNGFGSEHIFVNRYNPLLTAYNSQYSTIPTFHHSEGCDRKAVPCKVI